MYESFKAQVWDGNWHSAEVIADSMGCESPKTMCILFNGVEIHITKEQAKEFFGFIEVE